uniref:uncharacterized protein LOC120331049 n=1 Tax=Styela clava TaxID=7725 RepID=UPI0019396E93|nr:uncharacterized protein LOC120331049 [Styela clava]
MSDIIKISNLNMHRITRRSSNNASDDKEKQTKRKNTDEDSLPNSSINNCSTPESLHSISLRISLDEEADNDHYIDEDSDAPCSSSHSDCSSGYPLLDSSRSPSERTLPETPKIHENKKHYRCKTGNSVRFDENKLFCSDTTYGRNGSIESLSSDDRRKKKTARVSKVALKSNSVKTVPTEIKPLHPDVISLLMSKRPKSASTLTFSDQRIATKNTQTRNVPEFKSRHTQASEPEKQMNDITIQVPELHNIGIQCKRQAKKPKAISKGCQVVYDSVKPQGSHDLPDEKRLDYAISAVGKSQNMNTLRTTSAQCSRQETLDENFKMQRCKSALAILITRTRVSSSSGKRLEKIRGETTEFDVETSSTISLKVHQQDIQPKYPHRERLFTKRSPIRFNPNSRYAICPSHRNRILTNHRPIISPEKLAKLKKAYGKNSVNMSGLNVRKLRLPMHCGYRCMSANDVNNIVNRLSHLSCRTIHDCCRGDQPNDREYLRCRTATPYRNSDSFQKNLYEVNKLAAKTFDERQKLGFDRIRSAPGNQDESVLENLENVLTKSLHQLDHSLLQAKNVISSLSGLIEQVSPGPQMDDMRTIKSAAHYREPRSQVHTIRRCKSQRGPRKMTIEATCQCVREKINSESKNGGMTNFPAIRSRSGKTLKRFENNL